MSQQLIALGQVIQPDARSGTSRQFGLDRIADNQRLALRTYGDRERPPVADLIVFDRIFDQYLKRHGRKQAVAKLFIDGDIERKILFVAHLHQEDIGLGKGELLGQRHKTGFIALQRVTQHARQLLRIVHRTGRSFADERLQRVERIEQHVGVQLVLQRFILVADALRAELLVLDDHLLLFQDQMDDVAAARHDARHDEIAQGMQVVMHHRIDGRNVERPVQQHEQLSQQIADHPGQQERKNDLGRRHPRDGSIEPEKARVEPEEDQQRDESEHDLVGHVRAAHSREERVLLKAIRERKQLREMDQHSHHSRYGHREKEVFIPKNAHCLHRCKITIISV